MPDIPPAQAGYRDLNGAYASLNQLWELGLQAAGKTMITKDEFHTLLPRFAHGHTVSSIRYREEKDRRLAQHPSVIPALPEEAIWYDQVNPGGYMLVPT
jgi:hypothetical protein